MADIKQTVAKNLTELRQAHNMTQLELAQRLNYSDKAISKWERGESIPDLSVLAEIADLFGVSLDYLIQEDHTAATPLHPKRSSKYNHTVMTLIALLSVWFLATLAFVLVSLLLKDAPNLWLCFVYAVPVTAIIWLVLNFVWHKGKQKTLIISILLWSVLATVQISFLPYGTNVWLIYLLGIPTQIILILLAFIRKKRS
ncbi:MAG: helix-turn-helix transcriptional regulator [Clostridia bacterium]|nr:helix-turn-helix transcriptional regulator [Clostridia bacterium]